MYGVQQSYPPVLMFLPRLCRYQIYRDEELLGVLQE